MDVCLFLLKLVGLCFPVDFPEWEIKWAIHPACKGRGYAGAGDGAGGFRRSA